MGCSRPGYSIFNSNGRFELKWYIKRNKSLPIEFWADSFMPFVCKVIGHKPYKPFDACKDEWACLRCHRYIEKEDV